MPEFIDINGVGDYPESIPYATEEEVLDFANRLRKIGGAEVIEAFFPSNPGSASSCLIANALNFGCSVAPGPSGRNADGSIRPEYQYWCMDFPYHMYGAEVERIAEEMGCEVQRLAYTETHQMRLPRLIGNAAHAFDSAPDDEDAHWVVKYRKPQ